MTPLSRLIRVKERVSNLENIDYESLRDELLEMLENKSIKQLRDTLEEMNEFDVAQVISELPRRKLAMVFRLLSKTKASEVFANLELEEQSP